MKIRRIVELKNGTTFTLDELKEVRIGLQRLESYTNDTVLESVEKDKMKMAIDYSFAIVMDLLNELDV